MADAGEGGVHYIAAGHYATETLGIRRLGEPVASRFGTAHEFIEVPNPTRGAPVPAKCRFPAFCVRRC